ncbi:hypothetical protein [Kitasatospora purpeofusca]|uniref:hypothetical protein n=1 Tax=Kitasatospora purpeofusca TaxID=67352 RepID=UPI0038164015
MIEKAVTSLPARAVVQAGEIAADSPLSVLRSSLNDGSADNSLLILDPIRARAACGVSIAAAFHVVVAALVLINRSR